MQAFTIRTNKSDYPFLVIADGFKSAVEVIDSIIHERIVINVNKEK